MAYDAVIGLECHLQLRTRTKMFCGCPAEFGAEPNRNVCPVCLGLPGALPRVNRAAVDAALRLGLALGCEVRGASAFARKHYFYPDMPKNYQITQYDRPLCTGGALTVTAAGETRAVGLVRIHLEEDAGKSFHPERAGDRRRSRVDYNRAGVPLLELVTRPDLRRPEECGAFLLALRRLARWLGLSDADMEKGHLRCDANVSLRPAGASALGTKTELKNLNSARAVERGLAAEIARQRRILEQGGRVEQATLLYDADGDRLAVMRTKEHAHDYRYLPEPDLPELRVDAAWLAQARARLPELPWERERRFVESLGVPPRDAAVLCEQRELAEYFEAVAARAGARPAANWVLTEVLGALRARGWTLEAWTARVPAERLAGLLERAASGALPGPLAKRAFVWLADEEGGVDELLARHGVRARGSAEEMAPVVREVLDAHPDAVRQVLAGKAAALGFLVGQVMQRTGGQAVPRTVRELLEAELARRGR
uniref:Aspartyl/glutamyl-tRNA(Asn/Gln) amidotransferase subunit B n=1 Tax=Eiseniibacteriota bacterium TaxID=2212470 RepID=A0A832MJJ3_UNCEI